MSKIVVDEQACIHCGACVQTCRIAHVFEMTDAGSHAVRPEACWDCGQCVSVCPVDAIDHDGFPLEKCPLQNPADLPGIEDVVRLLRSRHSGRCFEDRPVPRELVQDIVHIGRFAPSAQNRQAIDWIAIDDRLRIAEWSKYTVTQLRRLARLAENPFTAALLTPALGRSNVQRAREGLKEAERAYEQWLKGDDPIFYHAPVLLIGHAPTGSAFARDDAAYAAYNIMLAAEPLGLSACQIGIFQALLDHLSRLRRQIALPERRTAQITLVLGYTKFPFRRALPRRLPSVAWNPR